MNKTLYNLRTLSFILIMNVCVLSISAQTFIDRFQKLTENNLPEFFDSWKAYSDSISFKNVIGDSILAKVINQELSFIKMAEGNEDLGLFPEYYVVPQEIKVDRYHLKVDTLEARKNNGFPEYLPMWDKDVYESFDVTPELPSKGLYYTESMNKPLWEFLGGTRITGEMQDVDRKNVGDIEKYIPVYYGHWGGYWWFYSLPVIEGIVYFDNLIVVSRRTSWHTGDMIWYVKGEDGFERLDQPLSTWIE